VSSLFSRNGLQIMAEPDKKISLRALSPVSSQKHGRKIEPTMPLRIWPV
jgi:hypothetical protein